MKKTMPPKRRMIAYIPWEYLIGFVIGTKLTQEFCVINIPELPRDAMVCGIWSDHARQSFAVVFEHPSFPDVVPGEALLTLETKFTTAKLVKP